MIREFLSSTGGTDVRGFNDKYPGTITRSSYEPLHQITKSSIASDVDDLPDHLQDTEENGLTVAKQEKGTRLSLDPFTKGLDLTYGRLGVLDVSFDV